MTVSVKWSCECIALFVFCVSNLGLQCCQSSLDQPQTRKMSLTLEISFSIADVTFSIDVLLCFQTNKQKPGTVYI